MKKSPVRAGRRRARASYHHGMLREALIQAADEILAERGAEGFTLREAARRAGVSPAAPAHHFGSAAGLLTELAIAGFEDLTRGLREAAAHGSTPAQRLRAQGVGYVRFAIAHPGRFHVMFRQDLVVGNDERFVVAGREALAELQSSVRAYLGAGRSEDPRTLRATVLGAWSTVHGFAQLALDGKLAAIADRRSASGFVAQELRRMLLLLWPDAH